MSHKKVAIALILKIWLGFDSENLKLDHDMKIITLGLDQLGYWRLNNEPRFENWRKSVKNRVLKMNHLDAWKLKWYMYLDNLIFVVLLPC